MATSTCVKCNNTRFETKVIEPTGSNFKLVAIQCSSCGGVVGITEYLNIGDRIGTLAKKLNVRLD